VTTFPPSNPYVGGTRVSEDSASDTKPQRERIRTPRNPGADGADLVLTAPRPLSVELLDKLKAHKPAILVALADPGALWWRVVILEPNGRTIEVDTPSGWTLGEWAAYAERYHGPGCALTAGPTGSKPPAHGSTSMRPYASPVGGRGMLTLRAGAGLQAPSQ
jgi:hypothetical protein